MARQNKDILFYSSTTQFPSVGNINQRYVAPTTNIKSIFGLAYASVKSVN